MRSSSDTSLAAQRKAAECKGSTKEVKRACDRCVRLKKACSVARGGGPCARCRRSKAQCTYVRARQTHHNSTATLQELLIDDKDDDVAPFGLGCMPFPQSNARSRSGSFKTTLCEAVAAVTKTPRANPAPAHALPLQQMQLLLPRAGFSPSGAIGFAGAPESGYMRAYARCFASLLPIGQPPAALAHVYISECANGSVGPQIGTESGVGALRSALLSAIACAALALGCAVSGGGGGGRRAESDHLRLALLSSSYAEAAARLEFKLVGGSSSGADGGGEADADIPTLVICLRLMESLYHRMTHATALADACFQSAVESLCESVQQRRLSRGARSLLLNVLQRLQASQRYSRGLECLTAPTGPLSTVERIIQSDEEALGPASGLGQHRDKSSLNQSLMRNIVFSMYEFGAVMGLRSRPTPDVSPGCSSRKLGGSSAQEAVGAANLNGGSSGGSSSSSSGSSGSSVDGSSGQNAVPAELAVSRCEQLFKLHKWCAHTALQQGLYNGGICLLPALWSMASFSACGVMLPTGKDEVMAMILDGWRRIVLSKACPGFLALVPGVPHIASIFASAKDREAYDELISQWEVVRRNSTAAAPLPALPGFPDMARGPGELLSRHLLQRDDISGNSNVALATEDLCKHLEACNLDDSSSGAFADAAAVTVTGFRRSSSEVTEPQEVHVEANKRARSGWPQQRPPSAPQAFCREPHLEHGACTSFSTSGADTEALAQTGAHSSVASAAAGATVVGA